ncbi:histone-lysine N-methyltransferase SETMAR, partial [Trichonephila inaurata madagascariensis]
ALDDEALQAAIEEDSSQTCGELARQLNTSSEVVRLNLHGLGETYRLSKWVPHTLLEVHKQQRVAACLSLPSHQCIHTLASIFNLVLTRDEKWILYDTPKRSTHRLSPQDTIPHSARPPIHPCKTMLCSCARALKEFFASHTPEFYRKGNEQLETRWQKVLDADRDYFED